MEIWKIIIIVWFSVAAVFILVGCYFRRGRVGFTSPGSRFGGGGHHHHHGVGGIGGGTFDGGAFGGGGGCGGGGGGAGGTGAGASAC